MKLTSASFHSYFIATSSATCGICHKTINPGSIAHGHTWHSHSVIDAKIVSTDKIRDLFHRTCIQKSLSAGFETCPNCNCTVLNAEEYNKKHDFNKTKLAIQENRLFFIEHVRKRNLLALEQLLQTQSISHPFQYEALWMAVYTNDFELTKLLLFANQNAIPPIHLSLLLNQATMKGASKIVSIILEYNAAYLRLPNTRKSLALAESEIYDAFFHALEERNFSIADDLLHTNFLCNEEVLKKVFYFSIKRGYWNGMQYALNNDICANPLILEKALSLAAKRGDCYMLFRLLQEESASSADRGPAICAAITEEHPNAALLLLKDVGNLDLHIRGEAAMNASIQGYIEALQALIENGPLTKEMRYAAQLQAKNQQCLDLLSNAEIV